MAQAYASFSSGSVNWTEDVISLHFLNRSYVYSAAHSSTGSISGAVVGQSFIDLKTVQSTTWLAEPQYTPLMTGCVRYAAASLASSLLFYFDLQWGLPLPYASLYIKWPDNIVWAPSGPRDFEANIKYDSQTTGFFFVENIGRALKQGASTLPKTNYNNNLASINAYDPVLEIQAHPVINAVTLTNTASGWLPTRVKLGHPLFPPQPALISKDQERSTLYGLDIVADVLTPSSGVLDLSSTFNIWPKRELSPIIIVNSQGDRSYVYDLDSGVYDRQSHELILASNHPVAIYYASDSLAQAAQARLSVPSTIKKRDPGLWWTDWLYTDTDKLSPLSKMTIGPNWPLLKDTERIALLLGATTFSSSSVTTSAVLASGLRPLSSKYVFKQGPITEQSIYFPTTNYQYYDIVSIGYTFGSEANSEVVTLNSIEQGKFRAMEVKYTTTYPKWTNPNLYERFVRQTTVDVQLIKALSSFTWHRYKTPAEATFD